MSTLPHRPSTASPSASQLDDLLHLRELAEATTVARGVEAVRALFRMEVACCTEFVGDSQVFRTVRGDGDSFGVVSGASVPLQDGYCAKVLSGRLPNLIPDTASDDRASSLPLTSSAGIRAFVSIALRFSDGRLYGSLCAASRQPKPAMGYRELQFLHVYARLIGDRLELDGNGGAPQAGSVGKPDLFKRVSDARAELLDVICSIDTSLDQPTGVDAIRNELEDDLLLAANRLGRVAQRLAGRADPPS